MNAFVQIEQVVKASFGKTKKSLTKVCFQFSYGRRYFGKRRAHMRAWHGMALEAKCSSTTQTVYYVTKEDSRKTKTDDAASPLQE